MSLKNKRILITAGPTWVPLDGVRIISNIATGQTGILLARGLKRRGAKVTLLLGPVENRAVIDKEINVLRFRFFDELQDKITAELRRSKYDVVIHAAAVSDYKPGKIYRRKIKSGIRHLQLELRPTPKIIDSIKKISPEIFAVGFKFEPRASKEALLKEAKELIRRSGVDLVAANAVTANKYKAYLVSKGNLICGPLSNKKQLTGKLIKLIG